MDVTIPRAKVKGTFTVKNKEGHIKQADGTYKPPVKKDSNG